MDYYHAKKMSSTDMDAELEPSAIFSVEFEGSAYHVQFRKSGNIDSIRRIDGKSYWEDILYEMPSDYLEVLVHLSVLDFTFVMWVH